MPHFYMMSYLALVKTSLRLVFVIHLTLISGMLQAEGASDEDNLISQDKWMFRVGVTEGTIEHEITDSVAGPELEIRKLGSGPHDHSWWYQETNVVEGAIYDYAFEARGSGDDGRFGISAGVEWVSAEGGYIGFERLDSITNGKSKPLKKWKAFRGSFVVPRKVERLRLRFSLDAWVPAQAAFRNVSITRAAQPLAELLERTPDRLPVFNIPLGPVAASGVTLTPDWHLAGTETLASETRQRICINTLWAIQPAVTKANGVDTLVASEPPKADDWAFFKVPGVFHPMKPFLIYGQDKTTWKGRDVTTTSRSVWYARDVELPASALAGNNVYLTVTGMRGLSLVAYWNGKRVGTLTDQLGGRIDLTPALEKTDAKDPSASIKGQLVLHALATIQERKYAYLMEAGAMGRQYDSRDFPRDSARGLGDIYLDIEPSAPLLTQSQVQVVPSFRKQRLDILLGVPTASVDAAKSAVYAVTVRDSDGKVVQNPQQLRAVPDAQTGKLMIGFDWKNPGLWTPDDPKLYTLTIAAHDADGRLLDETLPIRFGFREVWVNGKDLMLNGQPLRLRPRLLYTPMLDGDELRRQFSFMKDMGFNSTLRPGAAGVHELERNGNQSYEDYYRIADEMGIMVIPFGVHSLIAVRSEFGEDGMSEGDQQHLFDYMARHMTEPLANHPSVIGWSGFGSGANYAEGMNSVATRPDVWGITPLIKDGVIDRVMSGPGNRAEARKRLTAAADFVKRLKTLDPSRPYFSHFDGGSGDVWGIWTYFNWTPVQEWEQWPEEWSKHGTMPIGATEHGFPYASSFFNHGVPDGNFEPWVTEYAAIDLGPQVFSKDSAKYLEVIRDGYNSTSGGYAPKTGAHHKFASDALAANEELVQSVYACRNLPIYRAWRTYGVSTGIEPFGRSDQFYTGSETNRDNGKIVADPSVDLRTTGFKKDRWNRTDYWPAETMPWLSKTPTGKKPEGLTPLGEVLYETDRPLLVYIAGEPDRPASKDHVFWGGEKITKQVAAIWDGFSPRELLINWKATLDANDATQAPRVLGDGTLTADLSGGDIKLLPIAWQTPTVEGRTEGKVVIEAVDAATHKVVATDTFAFTLYPEIKSALTPALRKARIVVLDPAGDRSESLAALRKIGLSPGVITSVADWNGGDLLVVGKGVLPTLVDKPGELAAKLPERVPVFVMEQTDKALGALGFRVYPARHRTVFPANPADSLLQGVAPADLADWRVSPTLLPGGVEPLRDGYLYHTGYDGAVISVSIETPTRGAFTPFLQCGFDLREAAVLEAQHQGQRWMFSQLSLTDAVGVPGDQPADPVASRLLLNLLDHMLSGTVPETVAGDVAVVGAAAETEFLHELGAKKDVLHRLALSDKISSYRLALVGDLTGEKPADIAALKTWVAGGGTAVVLPHLDLSLYKMLSPGLEVRSGTASLVPVPGGATGIFAGLGQNNFHYRQPLPQLLFADGGNVAEVREGKGRWVFLGFDPRKIDLEKQPYLRLTHRNQCRALSQILGNLGFPLDEPVSTVLGRIQHPPLLIDLNATGTARVKQLSADGGAGGDWQDFGLASQSISGSSALLEIRFVAPDKIPDDGLIADLGTIDDYDETALNGSPIGSVTPKNSQPDSAWKTKRLYPIPAGLLHPGENTLSLHVWNRNAAKGAPTLVRGPLQIRSSGDALSPYVGSYQRSDDPYLQRMW